MASTMVNVRMDEDVKRDMEIACKELGMKENLDHIRRGVAALDEGHGIVHELVDDE